MWGNEDGHGVSTVSDSGGCRGSSRLYDFVVTKTNDQEENVVARPGFTVILFIERFFLAFTSTLVSSEDGILASCTSTTRDRN